VLLTVDQPFSNHNGGNLVFGPDGLLYAGLGDGGSSGDPQDNAQNTRTLLGKMLRIDVSAGTGYTIPASNPFAANSRCTTGNGSDPCPEIFAFGFRNPWRFSFDRATGELWVGDVGQGAWEEVDRVVAGGNYGWRFREGAHCFEPASGCPTAHDGQPLIDPVAEYDHATGESITGGYVYRGTANPALVGRYVFADFISGRLFAHDPGSSSLTPVTPCADVTGHRVVCAGRGRRALCRRLLGQPAADRAARSGDDTIPTLLSDTGCVSAGDATQPSAGLIPVRAQRRVLVRRRRQDALARVACRSGHHGDGQRRLGATVGFGARPELLAAGTPGRDAAPHASSGRCLGGLQL
jgi:hypothetical protein